MQYILVCYRFNFDCTESTKVAFGPLPYDQAEALKRMLLLIPDKFASIEIIPLADTPR